MKTAEEIAAAAFPFDGSDPNTVREARARAVAAIEEAREGWVYKPVVVLTRSGAEEGPGVEVIDLDAFYDSPSDYDEDDVEGIASELERIGWDERAAEVRSCWAEHCASLEEGDDDGE